MMRFFILLCLLFPSVINAKTSLWKVSHGAHELFIGGTIHALSTKDFPLPVEFEQAYRQAEVIVFETDLEAMKQPETQQQLLQRTRYEAGKTLKDDLSGKTYQALKDYLSSIGLSIEVFQQTKPGMVVITLLMMELQRLGLRDDGVDSYFHNKAREDGKKVSELESLETQLDTIENMAKGHEDAFVLNSIDELTHLSAIMNEMKLAWRQGDSNSLVKIGILPMKKNYPQLYWQLLVKRNNAWVPKIEALLESPEKEFVLVGALHLISKDGVINKLRQLGYQVELFR